MTAFILDLMLPDMDDLKVPGKDSRGVQNGPPVLILSARGQLDDRVKGLEHGADDFLTKPFAFVELLARVRALFAARPADSGTASGGGAGGG